MGGWILILYCRIVPFCAQSPPPPSACLSSAKFRPSPLPASTSWASGRPPRSWPGPSRPTPPASSDCVSPSPPPHTHYCWSGSGAVFFSCPPSGILSTHIYGGICVGNPDTLPADPFPKSWIPPSPTTTTPAPPPEDPPSIVLKRPGSGPRSVGAHPFPRHTEGRGSPGFRFETRRSPQSARTQTQVGPGGSLAPRSNWIHRWVPPQESPLVL